MALTWLLLSRYRPEDIYHVTIMPCYDKKLEAARDDFIFAVDPGGGTDDPAQAGPRVTEVDSVLTSGEILDLLEVRTAGQRHCQKRQAEPPEG